MKRICKHKIVCITLMIAFLVSAMPVFNVFAEEKANDNGISLDKSTMVSTTETIYGDLNNDRVVDSGDYMTLRALLLDKITMKPEWKVKADLNDDGCIDSADYVILRKYLLGQIKVLPYKPQNISATPTPTVTTLTPTVTPTPIRDYIYSAVGDKFIIKQMQGGPIPPNSPNFNKWTYTITHSETVRFVETYVEEIPQTCDIWYKVWTFESLKPGNAMIEFVNYNGTEKKDYIILTYQKQLITPTPVSIDTTVGEIFGIHQKIPYPEAKIWEVNYDSSFIELVNEEILYLDCTGWDIQRSWEFKAIKEGNCVITCKSKELGEIHTYNVNIKSKLTPTPTAIVKNIETSVGNKFDINHYSMDIANKWTYSIKDTDMVKFVNKYREPIPTGGPIPMGSSDMWVFEALKEGKTYIEFVSPDQKEKYIHNITIKKVAYTPTSAPVNKTITMDDNGGTVYVKLGEEIKLSLESNGTTGFRWDYLQKPNDKALLETGYEYILYPNPSNLEGNGGNEVWTYKVVGNVSTVIELKYARPWESVPPAKTFSIKVIIGETPTPTPTVVRK